MGSKSKRITSDNSGLHPKISIGIVILTLNEELNIASCINSVSWANEIVILDSGSNDETTSIAKSKGARVYTNIQEKPFNISLQRNFALENCGLTSDWILFLDADETISDELKEEICKKINSTEFNAFSLTPKYYFWGKWLKKTQGYPNWHDRLLKRGEVHFEGGVWEHFSLNAKIGFINKPYNHYANSKGFNDWIERHLRYANWDAQKNFESLTSKDATNIGTNRKIKLRKIALKFWFLRPWGRFINMYLFRLGFLEGWKSFLFCNLYFIYELIILVKTIELLRINNQKPL